MHLHKIYSFPLIPNRLITSTYRRRIRRTHPSWPPGEGLIIEGWGSVTWPRVGGLRQVSIDDLVTDVDSPAAAEVGAFLNGEDHFRRFMVKMASDRSWPESFVIHRERSLKLLFEADVQSFVITVAVNRFGQLEVIDGHHRTEIARAKGALTIGAELTFPIHYRKWHTHRQIVMGLPFK